ncbi:MAG: HNH endonuclease signature motif containing protein [Clostridia bacterium]|nr:HNH endonuclease signature motif containing protein [Clostridia bacterium]
MGKYTKTAEIFSINNREVNGVKEHRCTKCQEWFPETEEYFYLKNKSNPEKGFGSECKQCTIERGSKYRLKHLEERKEYDKIYCVDNKLKRKETFSQWKDENLEYNFLRRKKWGQENPDKIREYNKNRIMHKKHKINKMEWENCKRYFEYECAYCGLPLLEHYYTRNGITKLGDFHKEHINHNGSNDLSNCVPSCGSCNDRKWKFLFDEWYNKENPRYSEERYNRIMQWLNNDWILYDENLNIENLDLVHNQEQYN